MVNRHYAVLFLCTGNSARSILAESILNGLGRGALRAFSAGSRPAGRVHPCALELLAQKGLPTAELRSKDWGEFAKPGAPAIDLVLTVCDSAAGEACPVWLGRPVSAHWGVADPAAAQGSEIQRRRAFADAYRVLDARIRAFTRLPLDALDPRSLTRTLDTIARTRRAPPSPGTAPPPGSRYHDATAPECPAHTAQLGRGDG